MASEKELEQSLKELEHYVRFVGHTVYNNPQDELAYAMTQEKECSKCKKIKTLDCYNGNTSGRDAFDKLGYRLRRPECSACTKLAANGKKVALQSAKRDGIPKKAPEGAACEICKSTQNLVFDHCHTKEVFRGWLCNSCNRSMGVLGDNIEGMLRCIHYLNKTEKKVFSINDNKIVIEDGEIDEKLETILKVSADPLPIKEENGNIIWQNESNEDPIENVFIQLQQNL